MPIECYLFFWGQNCVKPQENHTDIKYKQMYSVLISKSALIYREAEFFTHYEGAF